MQKSLFTLFFILSFIGLNAQNTPKFNLGFDNGGTESTPPNGWLKWGNYDVETAKEENEDGQFIKVISTGNGDKFGSMAFPLPASYEGKYITLRGRMKTVNVSGGFGGLLLRIDGGGEALQFDNMQNQGIKGSNDWKEYKVTLPFPEKAERIFVGGILVGKGEVWFDDFVVTIDGKDIQTLEEKERVLTKAELDKEFDAGSGITFPELNDQLISNLELLGKVWGLMKYYHPEIGIGNYNWDYELFRFLPDYMQAETNEKRDQLLIDWVVSYGKVGHCKTCRSVSDEVHKPNHEWMESLDDRLRGKLKQILYSRPMKEHHYIGLAPNVRNPKFKNENAYAAMSYPDEGFRLLALFRYWNMIHYYFPYKHLMDDNWDLKLRQYIPHFLNAENELEYELAAVQVIGDIQDTHANLWGGADHIDSWKGEFYAPVHVRFVEGKLVVVDYYNPELKVKVGLEIGDVISKIDGKDINTIVDDISKYYPASNEPTRLRDIGQDILRSNNKTTSLTIVSKEGKTMEKTLDLYPIEELNVYRWYRRNNDKCYKMLDNNIGYVTLASIKNEDIPNIKKEFAKTDGIIIDIRNYPSTFVPFSLGSYFVTDEVPFVKFTKGHLESPGSFSFTENTLIPPADQTYQGKLVVLINELSQSQAEYTSMAFRAGDNTTIIGSTTAGADGNISAILLPGGLRTMISGIGVYYPDGTETQRVGIIPDIEVKPTIDGVRAGRDELLEKAVEIIREEKK